MDENTDSRLASADVLVAGGQTTLHYVGVLAPGPHLCMQASASCKTCKAEIDSQPTVDMVHGRLTTVFTMKARALLVDRLRHRKAQSLPILLCALQVQEGTPGGSFRSDSLKTFQCSQAKAVSLVQPHVAGTNSFLESARRVAVRNRTLWDQEDHRTARKTFFFLACCKTAPSRTQATQVAA